MRRLRDVFYVNAIPEEKCYIYYGMEFREFIKYSPIPIDKILMLDPVFYGDSYNRPMYMSTLDREAIAELAEQGAYDFGNFHWLDYKDEESLNKCTEQEKAEALYLSHYVKPLHTPFFGDIGNNFAYLAHDDGFVCKLYCKDMAVMGDIIANKILDFFSGNKRRKIYPIGGDVKTELLNLAKEGLLINFPDASLTGRHWGLNLCTIGKFVNMDVMYNDMNRWKQFARKHGWLEQKDKQWKLDSWNRT